MTAPLLAPLFAYAAALGVAAAIPGPGVAALVGQSLGNGLRAALFFLAGLALGDLVYLTVAVAGLAALAEIFAEAFFVVKLVGGAYLIDLGWRFWTSDGASGALAAADKLRAARSARRGLKAFLSGFTVTLGNPKTIVFYLALVPSVLDLKGVGFGEWALLAAITIVVLFTVLSPYALLAAKAGRVMSAPATLKRLNRIAGGFVSGAGALILGEAVVTLTRRG
ncbi:LysE family translocator [Jiella sp. MQZ9-1]|uniref:LysE family translocator n=1 Tax=Jiella flava TaxID=2816857 RepID=A0A939JYD3_9HYPH|nr:LysE family translocator [Jiella flava]MBO0664296.1 LysE family translocator [Jiella flava]MCD2472781.1 LysE family translocator [Jiella flava]